MKQWDKGSELRITERLSLRVLFFLPSYIPHVSIHFEKSQRLSVLWTIWNFSMISAEKVLIRRLFQRLIPRRQNILIVQFNLFNTTPTQSACMWHMNDQTLKILLLAMYRTIAFVDLLLTSKRWQSPLSNSHREEKEGGWACRTGEVYSLHARTEEREDFEVRTEWKSVEIYSLWTEKHHYRWK